MSVWDALYKLILGPIELLLDVVFSLAKEFTGSPVLSIVVLSLAINLLVLPLYNKADDLQKEEQEISKRLKPRIDQIKEAFTGDERFMMLQTWYRQNNYKPWYALRGSLSLLLQIPFFMAAYNFLSGLQALRGVSFGPIADLAAPDAMLTVAGITVNVLPILMTVINIISGMIYTRGMPLKSKIQLYGMALIFLVLLYDSPAGLVFYWTLNNLFSLGKNILSKLKRPSAKANQPDATSNAGATGACTTGIARHQKAISFSDCTTGIARHQKAIFFSACAALTILTGLLIPSALISYSPAEFVELNALRSPLVYVFHSFLLAAGTFLIWSVIFYLLAAERRRPLYALVFACLALAAVVNYMFFGTGYGNISSRLVYDTDVHDTVTASDKLLNAGVLCVLAGAVFFLWQKKTILLRAACTLMALVIGGMSLVNMISVAGKMPEIQRLAEQRQEAREKIIHLDKNGKNVIVLMLDRALGYFTPFIFEEKPELRDQFAGFTCYLNTISYGKGTHSGTPTLFGGYEYTPLKLLERKNASMVQKQNEALRLMPLIFSENGFDVTVCDPPYANYSMIIPDLTIYDDHPEIHAYSTKGVWEGSDSDDSAEGIADRNRVRERNLFCYSVFRSAPVLLHSKLYDSGNYNKTDKVLHDFVTTDDYLMMKNLPEMTLVQAEGVNTFLMKTCDLTHEPQFLQEPEYEPSEQIDNYQYDLDHPSRTAADGWEIQLTTDKQKMHYQVNMAAMILIGRWLDFLREEGVYDNTRIILVADHGIAMNFPGMQSDEMPQDTAAFNPLLLVKDFDNRDPFAFSDAFMTNADTPTLAFTGLIENPVNPATGDPITDQAKSDAEQVVTNINIASDFDAAENAFFVGTDNVFFVLKNHNWQSIENWSVLR